MKDLDPAELSALLDGELDPRRAGEVRALIAADPELRAAFNALELAHGRLSSIAQAARFRPQIRWPEPAKAAARPWLAAPLAAALIAWAVGKLAPAMAVSLLVNAAALSLFVAWLIPLAMRESRRGGPFAA